METAPRVPDTPAVEDVSSNFISSKSSVSPFDKSLSYISTPLGKIPVLADVWEYFCMKGAKTVYYSINPEHTVSVDIEFAESLGCPLHILTTKPTVQSRWDIISKTLKQRKIDDEDKADWLEGIQKHWVLPKNILTQSVSNIDWKMLKELNLDRIDLLKIETTPGEFDETRMFLYSVLDQGYRPGLLLFNFPAPPNQSTPSMILAAHLQNSGYHLLKAESSWFLYSYTDVCIYSECSWENNTTPNPFIKHIVDKVLAKVLALKNTPPVEGPSKI